VEARDIAAYQRARLSEGSSPKTINLEIGTLRALLRRSGHWAYLRPDVKMLRTHEEPGRALTNLEEEAVLRACSKSRSRSLYTAVMLALATAMRYSEIRLLTWGQVDLAGALLTVGESKTAAATGRRIPLNSRILTVLKEWAALFPARQPEHFVFPSEHYGAAGDAFVACTYAIDPSRPITSWKTGWGAAKRRAGLEGPQVGNGQRVRIRFHDLRHTACTRMLEGGVSFHVVAAIMGWSTTSMIRMSRRYGHIGDDAQRQAVEILARSRGPVDSFEKSPEVSMGMSGRIQ
jgi:integrase